MSDVKERRRGATTISSKHHSATFTFKATGSFTGLQCALVKKPTGKHKTKPKPRYRACTSPKTYKHLKKGHYTFYVRAISGSLKGSAATHSFKIT